MAVYTKGANVDKLCVGIFGLGNCRAEVSRFV
jgi:hypothetical protein